MPQDPKQIRVRFAPSPTGLFSLGNARTALFNWLFAKHENGQFLLRIEDTDKERSKKKFETDLLKSLKWLGLNWDEEIIYQSKRLKIYEKCLKKLIQEEKAYWCFCAPEELEIERQAQLSQGLPPKYGGRCRNLTPDKVKKFLKIKKAVIRFKVPDKEVVFNDLVRGKTSFNAGLFGDIIIAKGLEEPLYNFAAAVDDYEMKISHVIRGEDHLSNTPKQILIQEALGFSHPLYAHLPLILGPDRKKLSKRYLTDSLNDYQKQGYLKEAFLNFLVLLGWHPEQDREALTVKEMIQEFSLKRVQKAGAIFNPEKLDWLNAYYIKNMEAGELVLRLKSFMPSSWQKNKTFLNKVIAVEKERLKHLSEFRDLASFFFQLPDYPKELLSWKQMDKKMIQSSLKSVAEILKKIPPKSFEENTFEPLLNQLAEEKGRGEIFWPLRVALSGQEASPGPIDLIKILGQKESLKRIAVALAKLEK